jgi:glycosyltransferase involved in cell wall biosynthesis
MKIETPTVCINMIVKNESKIITRMLDTVLPIIDAYCICDTGSTDNTVQIIEDYFKEKNIPGKVVVEPFLNFAHNRNFALKACEGLSDYILLMDADMKLKITNFDKAKLRDYDSCYILQGSDNFYYQNMRIVKNDGRFNYVGVTHEYVNTPSDNKLLAIKKDELFIDDLGDGGCKNDKFERDVRLLTGAIEANPNCDRSHFYLANSYHDSGQYEMAIPIYEKRIKIGGWAQEVWYSYYRIGNCYKNLGNMDKAISVWMEAYQYLPIRVENLYEIIYHYRNCSKHKLAEMFYQQRKGFISKIE